MEPIFEAVLRGEKEVAQLLRDDPAGARARATRDSLVEAIPHWLYAGDTSLHLAAAGLWMEIARLLLAAGADPNAQNRRGATPLHYASDPRPRSGGTWDPAAQASLIQVLVEHSPSSGGAADRGQRHSGNAR
jgi:ankyrin repeat protein